MPASDMDFKWSDGSSSSLRKISDDLLRTRIQEVDEEADNYFPPLNGRRDSYDRRSSLGGVSSNDSLWADARRLSEAGVRRTSDHSVVLTEDTDSFIIGDRVWVGGTKPGQIAYIGETQFAPGEWAGIVLDDPIGKNDGSVGGIRYFQCESKRGVFSRLGRLTRAPLASPPSTKPTPSPTPPPIMSPTSSIKGVSTHSLSSILKTPAPVSSPPSPSQELRVGDRVIVSSGQGSKIGVLRFKGPTYFAPGEWCGVELDDPLGKNNGSVEGYRYFECAPKYGLFALANKVTKSPAPNSRRQSCQLHHGTVRRHSSRESLNSNASSIKPPSSIIPVPKKVTKTSTSPSSLKSPVESSLKEKQLEIDKLLKERELERSRMTRAAQQAEQAEKQLYTLQDDFDQFRISSDQKMAQLEAKIRKLEEEKLELSSQLEDVQFRAEEETIIKSDIQVMNEENIKKIKELEASLKQEKEKVNQLLKNEDSMSELMLQISQLQEELKSLKSQKDQVESELKQELIDTIDRANRMEENNNVLQDQLDNALLGEKVEGGKQITEQIRQMEKMCKDIDEMKVIKIQLEKKVSELQDNCTAENDLVAKFKKELDETVEKASKLEEQNSSLHRELEHVLNNEKSTKERLLAEHTTAIENVNSIISQLRESNDEVNSKLQLLENKLSQSEESEEKLKKDLTDALERAEKAEEKCKHIKEDLEMAMSSKDITNSQITQKYNQRVEELNTEISQLKSIKTEYECKVSSLENNLKEEISKSSKLNQEVADLRVQSEQLKEKTLDLQDNLEKGVLRENTVVAEMTEKHTQQLSKLNNELQQLNMVNTQQSSKITELQKKIGEQSSCSNALKNDLLESIERSKELSEIVASLRNELDVATDDRRKAEGRLLEKHNKEVSSLNQKITELNTKNEKLCQDIKATETKLAEEIELSKKLTDELKSVISERDSIRASLRKAEEAVKILEQKLETTLVEIDLLKKTHLKAEQHLQESKEREVGRLNTLLAESENKLQNAQHSIDKLNKELEEIKAGSSNKIEDINKKHTKEIENLKKELEAYTSKIIDKEKELSEEKIKRDENEKEVSSLLRKLETMKQTLETKSSSLDLKEKEISNLKNELQSILSITGKSDAISETEIKGEKLQEEKLRLEKLMQDANTVSEKNQQIINLKEELDLLKQFSQKTEDDLASKLKASLEKVSTLEESSHLLQQQMSLIAQREQEMSQMAKDSSNKLEMTQKQLEEAMELKTQQESTIADLKGKLEAEVVCITELKSELDKAIEKSNKLGEDNILLQKELDEMTIHEKSFKLEMDSQHSQEVITLQNAIDELHSNKAKQDHIVMKLESDLKEKEGVIQKLEKELKETTEAAVQSLKSLKTELEANFGAQVKELKDTLDNAESVKTSQLANISQFKMKLKEADEKINSMSENITKLNQIIEDNVQKREEDLSVLEVKHLEELEALKLEMKTAADKALEKEKQLTEEHKKQSQKDEMVSSLQSTLDQLNMLLEAKILDLDRKDKEILKLQSELEAIRMDKCKYEEASYKDIDSLKSKYNDIHAALQKTKESFESAENQKAALEAALSKEKVVYQKEIQEKETAIRDLKTELDRVNIGYHEKSSLVVSLESQLRKPQETRTNGDHGVPSSSDEFVRKVIEEKELAESQVEFLNSIIFDLKNKNDELSTRISTLEANISSGDLGAASFHKRVKEVAPRMFCDICDMFDLHETEDCPRQGTESPPPTTLHHRPQGKFSERPYCENCEMFGHDTAECDDGETY